MVCLSVCLSICMLVMAISPAKAAESVEMPFGGKGVRTDSRGLEKDRVLNGVS